MKIKEQTRKLAAPSERDSSPPQSDVAQMLTNENQASASPD